MPLRQWTVDAFASAPFRGNPACVVEPLDAWPADAFMQALAMENNQAETAFLTRTSDPARFGLRWFTPKVEVPLCGHATLASAHALMTEMGVAAPALTFDTASGPLIVRAVDDGFEMDFPADPPRRIETPPGLADALGARPVEVWQARYLVAILEDEAAVRALAPDVAAIERTASAALNGERGNVVVAALAEPGADHAVVSRFFAPGSGVAEDPATGSAHCILAPLFEGRLGPGPRRFHQAYPGRGGDLICEVRADRVLLTGRAVTTVEGVLRVAP